MNQRATNEMRLTYHQEFNHITMNYVTIYRCMSWTQFDSLSFTFRAIISADFP